MDGWIASRARGYGAQKRGQSCLLREGSSMSLVEAGRGGIIFPGASYLQAISSPTLAPGVSPCGEQAWYHLLGGRERWNEYYCSSCAYVIKESCLCWLSWEVRLERGLNKGQRDLGATQRGTLSHFMSLRSCFHSCTKLQSLILVDEKSMYTSVWERQTETERDTTEAPII